MIPCKNSSDMLISWDASLRKNTLKFTGWHYIEGFWCTDYSSNQWSPVIWLWATALQNCEVLSCWALSWMAVKRDSLSAHSSFKIMDMKKRVLMSCFIFQARENVRCHRKLRIMHHAMHTTLIMIKTPHHATCSQFHLKAKQLLCRHLSSNLSTILNGISSCQMLLYEKNSNDGVNTWLQD